MGNTQEIVLLSNDKALRSRLRSKLKETDLEIAEILRDTHNIRPEGLNIGTLIKWMDGSARLIRKDHLDWIIFQCDQQIAKRQYEAEQCRRIPISSAMHVLLQSEVKRTGLGAVQIMRHGPKPLPDGLGHQKIQCWISGNTKTAKKTHWDFVLQLYASIETCTPHPQR